jgi:hypothetical protein
MWNTLSASQILTGFSPQEIAFLQNNLGGQQAALDALAPFINDEIAALQGAVIAGGSQQGQPGTVPDQLRPDFVAIVRWRLLLSYPSLKSLQTDARKDAFTRAQDKISEVANGRLKVELPPASQAQANPAPVNAVQTVRPGRHVTTHEFDKLGST